jgi:hypothetical protein
MSAGQILEYPNSGGPRHPAPEDLILFAMDLVPADEAASFTRHLESCAECRDELALICGDLALTALTVDLESPSEASRQRFVQQVAREKKIVGLPTQQRTEVKRPVETQTPIAAFGRSASILSIEDRPQKHVGPTLLAVAGWAVAAALTVAFTLQHQKRDALNGTLSAQAAQLQRLNSDAASAHKLMDALTDPQAVRVTLTSKPLPKAQPIGGVTYNPSKGSLVFLASNLDPLEAYKTYELWVIPADGTAPIPAGTFHPDDQGNASVIMPNLPKGIAAKEFGITIEADGGAQTPTAPIIMAGS